jgi:tetratricopeptide (TPR) repeat protein
MAKMQQKKTKDAIINFAKGVGYVIDNKALKGQFLANLGDAYNQDKNNTKSDSCYEKALEVNPNDVYVLNNYSYYLSLRLDKLEKAEAMSKKSNELEPNNASYLDTYAWILYAAKKYNDAKSFMEKALAIDGNKNPVLLEHYGDILYRLEMKENAIEFWTKAKIAGKGSDFLEQKIAEKKLIE